MSWAQITMQASSSEEDVRDTATRQSRQNKDKRPIVIIASPHPTMLSGNYDSASPVQMGASMMSTPSGGRAQGHVVGHHVYYRRRTHSAASNHTCTADSIGEPGLDCRHPDDVPEHHATAKLSGGLQNQWWHITSRAKIQEEKQEQESQANRKSQPSLPRIVSITGTPGQRSPATSRKGSGFALLQADIESQDSGSRSSGSLTAIAITDLSESQRKAKKKAKGRARRNKLKRKSSTPDDALARAFVEALSQACSPAFIALCELARRRPSKKQVRRKVTRRRSSTRTTRRRVSNADNALTQAVVTTLSGTSSTAGGLGTTPSMSALITATSTGALTQVTPTPQAAGQMNFVLNIPNANSQDPSLNTLRLTIVQDPNAAAQAARRR
ncbi:hypothetical protein HPB50_013184 [Hyalomma asiaticum]|uniref:Uncharacterized protein n=1 Tax=Hyalomma asiaticum TaxID=266040 RepID=A0ACB7SCD0_HYAAI|nr:hypothetical protein HPB50_013184 [Hyalomma asiaticum]